MINDKQNQEALRLYIGMKLTGIWYGYLKNDKMRIANKVAHVDTEYVSIKDGAIDSIFRTQVDNLIRSSIK